MKEDQVEARYSGEERILEIVVFLLTEIRQNKQVSEIDLKPLSERGYTQGEISTAFSWLFERGFDARKTKNFEGFRMFHEIERRALSREAQGYLLQLRALGVL